jgi:hypothetical protein
MTMRPSVLSSLFRPRDSVTTCHGRPNISLTVALSLTFLTASLNLVSAQSTTGYKEPDYSKFKVEDGQITLEFWSWVGGLDNTVKDFEKA